MRLPLFIIILSFLWWGLDARAQVPEELSSMPEQWQLTLDVIKSKAQNLLVENNGLQGEYRQLIDQAQKLQQSIDGQQSKNEQLELFLNERHGLTDQQMRIEELTGNIKTKSQQVRDEDQQLEDLKRKQSRLDYKIQQAPAAQNTAQSPVEDQLPQLRKQLEDETRQEVLLENELEDLKAGGKIQNLGAGTLKERKEELEADIYAYELRMEELRRSSLTALSWPLKKKELVHEMVQVDARNNKMRDQIKGLHEDIDVLKDQVAKLERRVNFAQDKDQEQ
jgi:chromosome segregation ATPase